LQAGQKFIERIGPFDRDGENDVAKIFFQRRVDGGKETEPVICLNNEINKVGMFFGDPQDNLKELVTVLVR
jgi:hypothetical protein